MRRTAEIITPASAWPALIAAIIGFALPAHAGPAALSSEAIKDAISGATVHLDTPLGSVLPLVFKDDGSVSGTAAGSLAFYLGSSSDRGRWWVANGKLCQKWGKWFDAEASCMQIHKQGARFEWRRDDGKSGTATIVGKPKPAIQPAVYASGVPLAAPQATLQSQSAISVPTPVLAVRPRTAQAALPPVLEEAGAIRPIDGAGRIERYRVVNVPAGDVLNIRAQPFATAAIVAAIQANGRGVYRIGACQRSWCVIRHDGQTGWVNATYLEPEPSTADASR